MISKWMYGIVLVVAVMAIFTPVVIAAMAGGDHAAVAAMEGGGPENGNRDKSGTKGGAEKTIGSQMPLIEALASRSSFVAERTGFF